MRNVGKCSGWWELKCPPPLHLDNTGRHKKKEKKLRIPLCIFHPTPPHLLLIIVHGVGQAKTCLSTGWVQN